MMDNVEPSGDYETLRRQFLSLRGLANAKSEQLKHIRNLCEQLQSQQQECNADSVNAERDTNATLTHALEAAEAEREHLRAENERLRELLAEKLIDSTMLTGIDIDRNALSLSANGGICKIMADSFAQILHEGKVINYVEAFFSSSKHPEMGQIVVTIKKETGKTPHQLRLEAEKERDVLRDEVDFLRKKIGQ